MACSACNENTTPLSILSYSALLQNCGCETSSNCGVDASVIRYTGPNLYCSGIETCDTFDNILSKIDSKLCATLGDISSYNTACISDGGVNTLEEFVEAASSKICEIESELDIFKETTFTNYQTTVNERFDDIESPGITCTSASITSTDTLSQVYTKYCTKFAQLTAAISIGDVEWDQCFVVGGPPSTIAAGFDLLINQICQLKSDIEGAGITLPTFNNTGSCLASPTSSDSLVDTVNKIKTKLCTLPTFDNTTLSFGCVTTSTTLQGTLQNILTNVTSLNNVAIRQVSSDFTLVPITVGTPCDGYRLTLSGAIANSKVALNGSDATPDYLLNKIQEGTNITFDTSTTPGKVIINSTGGITTDQYVKINSGGTAGYLEDKIEGSTNDSITVNIEPVSDVLQVSASIDMETFITTMLELVEENEVLKTAWCNLNATCPSPCSAPSNVTVVYETTSTTTTTTTTVP